MDRQAAYGRIGGLTAWSRNGADTMLGGARRGFRQRFLNQVDPDGVLPEVEREARADRARRAYMLTLAAKSADARRRNAAPDDHRPDATDGARRARDEHPTIVWRNPAALQEARP
jgi:hypothetical protein